MVQLRASKPFVLTVTSSDWLQLGQGREGFGITVPAAVHKKGKNALPRLEFPMANGAHEIVMPDIWLWPNGDIGVIVGGPQGVQAGRIVIA